MTIDKTIEAIEVMPDSPHVVSVEYLDRDEDGNLNANDLCLAGDLKALAAELHRLTL